MLHDLNMLYYVPNLKSDNFAAKMLHGWWMSNVFSANTGYLHRSCTNRSRSGNFGGTTGDFANVATPADATNCPTLTSTYQGVACKMVPVAFDPNTVIQGKLQQWYNRIYLLSFDHHDCRRIDDLHGGACPAAAPGFSTLGDVPRGLLRGPGLADWDLALNKDTGLPFLGEQGKLEFRAEVFNILNHANFAMPSGTVLSEPQLLLVRTGQAPSSLPV